ncbi:hypothetical protein EYW49_21960 [Siculibacillus lacustris]|uniref:Uncharacterized protein n=1 Tax=Siculibacillus lacustris TaxID=1549641 RepID=A0A4V2KSG0_9HYPH|nr:hypothetical protein [Siculibacillus lacustris]TBW32606.1 hypothetical protein EYW49_21960 [Siculibacillus lacustris]
MTAAACADRTLAVLPDRPVIAAPEAMAPCRRKTTQPTRLLTVEEIDLGWRTDRDRLEDCADRHDVLIAAIKRRQ